MPHFEKPQGKIGAIIVAAGESRRMVGVDKLFYQLYGKPVLARVLDVFNDCNSIDRIVVVLNKQNMAQANEIIEKQAHRVRIDTCLGGKRRQDSVLAGFKVISDCDWIIIHDAARPFVTVNLIETGIMTACDTGAAIPALPATDTVKLIDENDFVRWTPQRDRLYLCQTPQVFYRELLEIAFTYVEQDVTDEAQLVELSGGAVKIYQGAYDNIKITTPADLAIARVLWRQRKSK